MLLKARKIKSHVTISVYPGATSGNNNTQENEMKHVIKKASTASKFFLR
jgi:hypothetical protein